MKLELDNKNVKIKDLLNGQFLELECWVISDANPNRNGSWFTLESMQESLNAFKNRPVLGAFNDNIGPDGDFMGHEDNGLRYDPEFESMYYDYLQKDGSIIEVPLGTVRESDPVDIVVDKKTGLHWIKLRCALWTAYNYKAIKSLLKSRKGRSKISVEVEINESEMVGNVEKILHFTPLGFTILGSRENGQQIEEGIEGAHLTVLDFFENKMFAKKAKALHYAYSALENYNNNIVETSKGGTTSVSSVEDSNKLIPNNSNTCEFSSDSDDVNEAPEEEITMENQSQEGGNNEMLTMNEKRELLDNWLKANRASEHGWIWVCDMTDTEVFYNLCNENDEDLYYRAPYSITEDEEGHPVAMVDIENEVRVVKKWADFANDEPCDCEDGKCEKCEDNAGDEDDAKCENSTECEEAEKCEESAEKCEESKCNNEDSDDLDDSDDDDSDEKEKCEAEEKCEEAKCDESKCEEAKCDEAEKCADEKCEESKCEMEEKVEMEEDNGPTDLNTEPTEPAGDGLTSEESLEAATASIRAPEIQTEADNVGDAAENVEVETNAETPAEDVSVAEPEGSESEAVSEGPDGEKAEVIDEPPAETSVEQPNDEDKEKLYSATVNVNGTDVDINTLYSKYAEVVTEYEELNKKFEEMKTNYDALQNEVKINDAKKLVEFGANFVNSEEDVDADTKANFIKQIEEKCMTYEFSDEDSVSKFAKSLVAMYLYEKRSSHKNNNSIVMPINVNPNINSSMSSKDEAFDNAFNKLKNI